MSPIFGLATLRSSGLVAAAILAVSFVGPAHAVSTRVDDSGTMVSESVVPMKWAQLVPGRGADHSVYANVRVAVRLNLVNWLNQPVRLYMGLAPTTGEKVTAAWRTQGRLLPGDLRSGSRTLIFIGIVSTAALEETIDLALKTDGRTLVSPHALQFFFEVDTP